MMVRSILLTLLSCLLMSACSNEYGNGAHRMSHVFSAVDAEADANALSPVDDLYIGIQKNALAENANFLLSGSVIPQVEAPTSTGLVGKVVRFKRHGNDIAMYASSEGLVVTEDLPSQLLLAKFPIVKEDEEKVVFDFDKGLQRLFVAEWWKVEGEFSAANMTGSVEVITSQVFAMDFDEKANRLMIRQSVQAKAKQALFSSDGIEMFEMRYYLSPYIKNENFTKKLRSNGKKVGYFVTPAQLELTSGSPRQYALRFDTTKPIKFYYSANTPKEYIESVKDGILYWNKSFGKDLVQAAPAPEGMTSPDPGHNIVQWVPWDSAGFAYADIIADPLTGESLHGQVYMTSVFAIKNIERARQILRLLESQEKDGTETKNNTVSLSFLASSRVCAYDTKAFRQSFKRELSAIINDPKVTNDAVLRFSQDYIREVVAHEIGHVLGLRHNYAGSLLPNTSLREAYEWFKTYFQSPDAAPEVGDKHLVTTVMDYSPHVSAIMAGSTIREGKKALPYDKAAIEWGYSDKDMPDTVLYCTDEDTEVYADCNQFDSSPIDIKSNAVEMNRIISTLPAQFIEQFVSAKIERDPLKKLEVDEVDPKLTNVLGELNTIVDHNLKRFDSASRYISVERLLALVSDITKDEILDKRWETLNSEIEKFGSDASAIILGALPVEIDEIKAKKSENEDNILVPRIDTDAMLKQVKALLVSDLYTQFYNLDGESLQFSEKEREIIVKRAESYFKIMKEKVLMDFMGLLNAHKFDLAFEANGIEEDKNVDSIQSGVLALAKHLVLTQSPDKEVRGEISGAIVIVKEFEYDIKIREAAAGLLGASIGGFQEWSEKSKESLKEDVKKIVNKSLLIEDAEKFDEKKLSKTLRFWYKQQKSVMDKVGSASALPPKPAPTPRAGPVDDKSAGLTE